VLAEWRFCFRFNEARATIDHMYPLYGTHVPKRLAYKYLSSHTLGTITDAGRRNCLFVQKTMKLFMQTHTLYSPHKSRTLSMKSRLLATPYSTDPSAHRCCALLKNTSFPRLRSLICAVRYWQSFYLPVSLLCGESTQCMVFVCLFVSSTILLTSVITWRRKLCALGEHS
jgi:hypothetical protein